jgi:stage V sporulation protein G
VEITEVRIKLMDDPHDRLQAFCSITFDGCFVIRDLKIIQGAKGPFVAMPSRKLTDRCPKCQSKNHLRALHCNECGAKLDDERATKDTEGRAKLYADIAHPINSECRELIQEHVIHAFEREKVLAQEPNYVCTYDDYGEDTYAVLREQEEMEAYVSDQALPLVFRSTPETTHRIEKPTGQNQPPAPHHRPNGARKNGQPREAVTSKSEDEDEGFGVGLD